MGSVHSIEQVRMDRDLDSGWVKVYRSLKETSFKTDPLKVALWLHLILEASHKKHKTLLGGQTIDLQPGQFISGYKKLSKETGISEQSVKTNIEFFIREGMLNRKSTNKGSVFTLLQYTQYQSQDGQKSNKLPTPLPNTQDSKLEPFNGEASAESATSKSAGSQQAEVTPIQENNKLNTTNSNELDNGSAAPLKQKKPAVPYKQIADLYNEFIGDDFPKIKIYNTRKRKGLLGEFWRLVGKDLNKCREYFEFFSANCKPHHRGDNDRGWIAGPEFIMREDVVVRAVENHL